MKTVPITAQQAQAIANLFLSDQLGDRFTADQPQLTATGWQVPIICQKTSVSSVNDCFNSLMLLISTKHR